LGDADRPPASEDVGIGDGARRDSVTVLVTVGIGAVACGSLDASWGVEPTGPDVDIVDVVSDHALPPTTEPEREVSAGAVAEVAAMNEFGEETTGLLVEETPRPPKVVVPNVFTSREKPRGSKSVGGAPASSFRV